MHRKAITTTFQNLDRHPPDVIKWMIACEEDSASLMAFSLTALLYPDVTVEKTPGRNEPCPWGSGKKYKKCCAR